MEDFVIKDGKLIRYNGQDSVVKIPDSVIKIGALAFYNCTGLTNVTIPNSVTSIGDEELAFDGCTGLTSINVAEDNLNYASIDGVLYSKDKNTLIKCPDGKTGSFTIPNSVTSIGDCAFYYCTGLTSVTIPNSVTSIGMGAFRECRALTNIEIPNSVTTIGDWAFEKCSALTNITIPSSVTSFGNYVFQKCKALAKIELSNSMTSIGGYAFEGCSALTSITIPSSVTQIKDFAFYGCKSLTNIEILNSMASIGYDVFYRCTKLQYNEYDNGLYLGNKENPYAFLIKTKSTDITACKIKDTCKYIGARAFYECRVLTSITIPNSVINIGGAAFSYCMKLTNITIPNSVINIGVNTFLGCSELTNIVIPNSVTRIRSWTFRSCPELTNIIGDNIKRIEDGVFKGCKIKHNPKNNIAYKGFNHNMTCRDFQYREGETYTCNEAKLCRYGFHACLNPLDCFTYYYDKDSIYHEVILEDRTDETGDDSKICGKKITIGRRLTIQEMFAIFNELNKE